MIQAFIGILFFIIALVLIIGFFILRVIHSIFSPKTRRNYNNNRERKENQWTEQSQRKEKLFSKDEGEYIEFEEFKEKDSDKDN